MSTDIAVRCCGLDAAFGAGNGCGGTECALHCGDNGFGVGDGRQCVRGGGIKCDEC